MVYNWVDLGPGGNEPPTAIGNVLNDQNKEKDPSHANKDTICEKLHIIIGNIFYKDKVSTKPAGTYIYLLNF